MVLDGFQEILNFGSITVQDLSFRAVETRAGTTWFAGAINSEGLFLFQINGTNLNLIASHPQKDCAKIITEYCENGILLILEKQNGAIIIFRLTNIGTNYVLQPIQDFVSKDVIDLTTWNGMNQLYLGVTTPRNIFIYTWLGEHFDVVQTLNNGALKLVPFYSKGFMHIAATGKSTMILRYSLRTNNFEIVQRLRSSRNVNSFHVIEGHRMDHFLSLSCDDNTIIYKEMQDRFMPFQKLDLAGNTLAMVFEKTIILLSLTKDTLNVYQYDGWRFVKLNIQVLGVEEIRKVRLANEELLLMKKNNIWELSKITWTMRKSWKGLQDEIKQWCEDARVKAKRMPVEIPEFNGTLTILSGQVGTLTANSINEQNANDSLNILRKLDDLSSNLNNQKKILSAKKWPKNPVFDSLSAKKVNVKCNTTCKAVQVNIKKAGDPFQRSKTLQDENTTLMFKYLRITDTPTLRCPLPSFSTDNLIVKGLINNQNFEEMSENLLKTSGNQIVSGEHIIQSMNVTGIVIPLDVAIKSTKQMVEVGKLKVGELNIIDGGFLLPLNGSTTEMSGSIKADKVRLKDLIFLQGGLKGLEDYMPSILEMKPLYLKNDYYLQNIVIENLFNSSDIISESGKSINNILDNALPLKEDVPVNLEVSAKNMNWKNITLPGWKNFVPSNSKDSIQITGRKKVPRNVVVSNDIYNSLMLHKIDGELCGRSANASTLRTSILNVDYLIAKTIKSTEIIGQLKKIKTPPNFDFPKNHVYQKLTVKNLKVEKLNDAIVNGTEQFINKFEGPNLYKGSLNIKNLSVNVLKGPLNFPLPPKIRKLVSKANTYVGTINGINLKQFFDNAVTIHDTISFGNALFEGGLTSNTTYAANLPFKLQNHNANFVWTTKRILGNLETRSIDIPQLFDYNNDESAIISIQGSAKFHLEPSIVNINDVNLKELINKTWMKNEAAIFTSSNLHFENITVDEKAIVQENVIAPTSQNWNNFGGRILSKTNLQEIKVPISFNKVEVPFISGSTNSKIKSDVPELNDIVENALTNKKPQEITGKWNFQTLNISEEMQMQGKVNGLNLNKDVVRHDVNENIITGRKKVLDLTAKDLNGLDFDKRAAQAFTENKRKRITIKGRRTFGVMKLQNLSVVGTVMGKRLEDALLKSTDQLIFGARTINGSIETPGLIIDGLINDVNLTEIMSDQLKKHGSSQIINSDVEFLKNLDILGNITINRFDEKRIEKKFDEGIKNSPEKTTDILETINTFKTALNNRAMYVNKFEIIPSNSIDLNDKTISTNIIAPENNNCEVKNMSSNCNNYQAMKTIMSTTTDYILIKSILKDKNLFIISVQRKRVSIYTVDENEKDVHLIKELNIPRIEEAIIETLKDSLWIILQLPGETLLLRYESWQDLQDYVLPRTEILQTVKTPTNELLLILSDGIWKLEGSGEPKKLAMIPLKGQIESFSQKHNLFLKSTQENHSTLFRARYSNL